MRQIPADCNPLWGKMNVVQMVNHLGDAFRQANGKSRHTLHTAQDMVPKFKAFLMSDKMFRPETKNAMMADEPAAPALTDLKQAIDQLEVEINDFIQWFDEHPGESLLNPIFGDLNFDEWVQLLWKHSVHHLAQFGVTVQVS